MSNSNAESSKGCCTRGVGAWLIGNATTLCACKVSLLLLRLMVGVIFVVHGARKAFGWWGGSGFSGAVEMVDKIGFPLAGLFAVLLIVAELGGGIALILGVASRIAAFLIGFVMVVALCTAHSQDGFFGTHLQQMILVASVVLMIAGGGALTLLPGGKAHQDAEEGPSRPAEESFRPKEASDKPADAEGSSPTGT